MEGLGHETVIVGWRLHIARDVSLLMPYFHTVVLCVICPAARSASRASSWTGESLRWNGMGKGQCYEMILYLCDHGRVCSVSVRTRVHCFRRSCPQSALRSRRKSRNSQRPRNRSRLSSAMIRRLFTAERKDWKTKGKFLTGRPEQSTVYCIYSVYLPHSMLFQSELSSLYHAHGGERKKSRLPAGSPAAFPGDFTGHP